MATQDSLLKLKGSIEDLSFFKTRDGYQARRKRGVSAQRILTDPAFQRTRENGAEFGHGGRSAKYLRDAIRTLLLKIARRKLVSRLTQEMIRVVKSDTVSVRGERNVLAGDLGLLTGFDFNQEASLRKTLFVEPGHSIDRSAGTAQVIIPALSPEVSLIHPEGATHIRFVGGLASVDFVSGKSSFTKAESAELLLTALVQEEVTIPLALPSVEAFPLFLLIGIEFFQFINGRYYPLKNGAYNPLSLVEVNLAS